MDNLRRRVPFQFKDEDNEEEESQVLDEQQQEDLIAKLRAENESANHMYTRLLYVFLAVSTVLLLFSFVNDTAQRIPYPPIFTLLGLLINSNLFLLLSPAHSRQLLGQDPIIPLPLSWSTSYMLSLVPPTLCFFVTHGVPWPTIGWWCIPTLMVIIAHTVVDAMEKGNTSISELEGSRYRAPGA